MTDLNTLASMVEALDGPDRKLDLEIVAIVRAGMRHPDFIAPPAYTESLDAAMTLVPEGWAVERAGWHSILEPYAGFELWQFTECDDGAWRHGGDDAIATGNAITPALALTAAALRSRAAMGEG